MELHKLCLEAFTRDIEISLSASLARNERVTKELPYSQGSAEAANHLLRLSESWRKVKDIVVKSKYCKSCEFWSKKEGTAEYDEWAETH